MSGSQRKTGVAINVLKGRYKVDLRTLHALCEANYARLLRLFPDYESCNSRRFALRSAQVQIDVIERSRYTTLFHLQSFRPAGSESQPSLLAPLRIDARAYHDAGMLEVVTFQAEGRIAGRYSYPNRNMHQEDEKRQQNEFLAEWLTHCLQHGEADISGLLPLGTEPA
jgi:uncharacterized protein YqiB (DUF1249 family)